MPIFLPSDFLSRVRATKGIVTLRSIEDWPWPFVLALCWTSLVFLVSIAFLDPRRDVSPDKSWDPWDEEYVLPIVSLLWFLTHPLHYLLPNILRFDLTGAPFRDKAVIMLIPLTFLSILAYNLGILVLLFFTGF